MFKVIQWLNSGVPRTFLKEGVILKYNIINCIEV